MCAIIIILVISAINIPICSESIKIIYFLTVCKDILFLNINCKLTNKIISK